MKIRPCENCDEPDVIRIWSECGLVVPQNNPQLDIERKLAVSPGWFLVGENEGRVVATCMVGYEGHRGWINYLAVDPSEQGKGLAKAMMVEAERLLNEAGCPKINLQVRSTNQKVLAFYESLGFAIDPVVSLGKRLKADRAFTADLPNDAAPHTEAEL